MINRVYASRVTLISGDVKRESGPQHANLMAALDPHDESRRGAALAELTFRSPLSPTSPVYPLQLNPLVSMNLFFGDDDLTPDKDWKHVFKKDRSAALNL